MSESINDQIVGTLQSLISKGVTVAFEPHTEAGRPRMSIEIARLVDGRPYEGLITILDPANASLLIDGLVQALHDVDHILSGKPDNDARPGDCPYPHYLAPGKQCVDVKRVRLSTFALEQSGT